MCTLAVHWGWLDTVSGFPDRLRENLPRQGFFEHPEYRAVRAHLPAPWQDVLNVAYYSGWRKNEILGLTWEEIDEAGGIIRLAPAGRRTRCGRGPCRGGAGHGGAPRHGVVGRAPRGRGIRALTPRAVAEVMFSRPVPSPLRDL